MLIYTEFGRHCNSCNLNGCVGKVNNQWVGCANPKCVWALDLQEHK